MNLEDQLHLVRCSVVSRRLSPQNARSRGLCCCRLALTTDTPDHGQPSAYSSSLRSLSALLITDTELNVMAAAAIMGLSSSPVTG